MKKLLTTMMVIGMTFAAVGCGSKAEAPAETAVETEAAVPAYKEDVAVADLQTAVAEELGENYWPNMEVPAEMLGDMYNLTEDLYEEVIAQMPAISVNVDTLIIVKAAEGKEQAVEEALLAWKKYNVEEALQYPMNMGKVQAATVQTYGRYVCLAQLGADTSAVAEGAEDMEAAVIRHCEEENAKALAVIEAMLTK